MMKLTPLPPPPRRRDFKFNRYTPGRVRKMKTKINAEKVDRFMQALWTFEKELKGMSQQYDDEPAPTQQQIDEGIFKCQQ